MSSACETCSYSKLYVTSSDIYCLMHCKTMKPYSSCPFYEKRCHLLNIKEYCNSYKEQLKEKIEAFDTLPVLGIVQVGNDPASTRYVKNKMKDCSSVSIIAELKTFDTDITPSKFISEVKKFVESVNYIIIQKPLPERLEKELNEHLKEVIPRDKDIDGFRDDSIFKACTPFGILKYLEDCNIDVAGKNCVVIGRSSLVGRPLAKMLIDKDATVTLCHSHTQDIYQYCRLADIVICAVGKEKFLNCDNVNYKATIIDVGINFNSEGKMVGDCYNGLETQNITPVPGGVGLLTRKALIEQVYEDWKFKHSYIT